MGCPNITWSNATSEDCLFLNVYAPQPPAAGKASGYPVVVYFPAGAFQWGAGNDAENNGYHKSITPGWKDIVFVSANYRAGIFGFLASESLSKRSGDNSSGLFGMHDQTMVLRWVQENIAAFGGDPKRVMIFGESAGATSMSLHLVMPENAGLCTHYRTTCPRPVLVLAKATGSSHYYREWALCLDCRSRRCPRLWSFQPVGLPVVGRCA
eukprot:SAG11_NODE_755_length_7329_cov_6.741355_2_plen_210_part_00